MEPMEQEVVQEQKNLRKIIMVDDVGFLLLSAKERLKDVYEIFPATSAKALFQILETVAPDCILLDINMPDIDGFETIKNLKADPRYREIPVMFLSSKNDRDTIVRARKSGAVDFIPKPFTDAELIESIEHFFHPEKRVESKPIILAVDDNPSILKAINSVLNHKYTVRTLANPQSLEEILKFITPDLFLLDCQMPDIHGFDLVPLIRKYPENADVPIIFLTSDSSTENISAAIGHGASDYILKPLNADVLHERIAFHLRGFVMKRRIREAEEN
ncbi:MAG: response regulator [Oscillospiraceae bacterium]|nr:response regulator [Oscillospiraceae bacterium]